MEEWKYGSTILNIGMSGQPLALVSYPMAKTTYTVGLEAGWTPEPV
jgi:hypothetical protein